MPITRDDVDGIILTHASVLRALRDGEPELAARIVCDELRRIVDTGMIGRICEGVVDRPPDGTLLNQYSENLAQFVAEEQRIFDQLGLFSLGAREMLAVVCSELEGDFLAEPLVPSYVEHVKEVLASAATIACQNAQRNADLMLSWTLSLRGAKAIAGVGLAAANKLALPVDWGFWSNASIRAGVNYSRRQAENVERFYRRSP